MCQRRVFAPSMLGILMVQWKSADFRRAIPQYMTITHCNSHLQGIISPQRSQKDVVPSLDWYCEETLTSLAHESCPGSRQSTTGVETQYNPHIIWYHKLHTLDHKTNTSYVAYEGKKMLDKHNMMLNIVLGSKWPWSHSFCCAPFHHGNIWSYVLFVALFSLFPLTSWYLGLSDR